MSITNLQVFTQPAKEAIAQNPLIDALSGVRILTSTLEHISVITTSPDYPLGTVIINAEFQPPLRPEAIGLIAEAVSSVLLKANLKPTGSIFEFPPGWVCTGEPKTTKKEV